MSEQVTYILHGKNEVTRNFNGAPHEEVAGGGTVSLSASEGGVRSIIHFVNGRMEERVDYLHYTIITRI